MAYCGPRGIPLSQFLSWDRADQDAALGWSGYEARRCQRCGWHPDERREHVHIDVCPGCARLAAAEKANQDEPHGRAHLAAGTVDACERCVREQQADQAVTSRG